jgi:hypothetical protein
MSMDVDVFVCVCVCVCKCHVESRHVDEGEERGSQFYYENIFIEEIELSCCRLILYFFLFNLKE